MSTNKPSIGSVVLEIALRNYCKKSNFTTKLKPAWMAWRCSHKHNDGVMQAAGYCTDECNGNSQLQTYTELLLQSISPILSLPVHESARVVWDYRFQYIWPVTMNRVHRIMQNQPVELLSAKIILTHPLRHSSLYVFV